MARRKRITVAAAVLPLITSCAAVGSFGDWITSKTGRDCIDDAPRNAVESLVRASPLLLSPEIPVKTRHDVLKNSLRVNGIRIGNGDQSRDVTLACHSRKRGGSTLTLSMEGQWAVTTAILENGMGGAVSAVNFQGKAPETAPFWQSVAAVGNTGPPPPATGEPLHISLESDPPPRPLVVTSHPAGLLERIERLEQAEQAQQVELAESEEVVRQTELEESTETIGTPESVESPAAPTPPQVADVDMGALNARNDFNPVCAVLRPPSLRQAIEASLLCADARWELLPPTGTEPQDFELPLTITLAGPPARWVRDLSMQYGLRFRFKHLQRARRAENASQ